MSHCQWQTDPWFLTVTSVVHLHQPGYIPRTLGRLINTSTLWKSIKLTSVFGGHVSFCVTLAVHRIIILYLLFTSWHCCCGLYRYYPTSSKCVLSFWEVFLLPLSFLLRSGWCTQRWCKQPQKQFTLARDSLTPLSSPLCHQIKGSHPCLLGDADQDTYRRFRLAQLRFTVLRFRLPQLRIRALFQPWAVWWWSVWQH